MTGYRSLYLFILRFIQHCPANSLTHYVRAVSQTLLTVFSHLIKKTFRIKTSLCFDLLVLVVAVLDSVLNTLAFSFTMMFASKPNTVLSLQGPPTDAPAVDTAEQVYISSLALLKVRIHHCRRSLFNFLAKESFSFRVYRC